MEVVAAVVAALVLFLLSVRTMFSETTAMHDFSRMTFSMWIAQQLHVMDSGDFSFDFLSVAALWQQYLCTCLFSLSHVYEFSDRC